MSDEAVMWTVRIIVGKSCRDYQEPTRRRAFALAEGYRHGTKRIQRFPRMYVVGSLPTNAARLGSAASLGVVSHA